MKKSVIIAIAVAVSYLLFGSAYAASAKEAWDSIVPKKKLAGRPEFTYLDPDPGLLNVLLYGDSISIDYTLRVRGGLKGRANVFRLHANGNHSGKFIELMNEMERTMRDPELDAPWTHQWDVIHFNVGLHDLKYVLNGQKDLTNGTLVTSLDVYRQNLRAIIAYLTENASDARLIFATTTPVPKGSAGRKAGDADVYNQAALDVLNEHPEISINDLHSLTKPNHALWWMEPGDVHFNRAGSNAQGDAVVEAILNALR